MDRAAGHATSAEGAPEFGGGNARSFALLQCSENPFCTCGHPGPRGAMRARFIANARTIGSGSPLAIPLGHVSVDIWVPKGVMRARLSCVSHNSWAPRIAFGPPCTKNARADKWVPSRRGRTEMSTAFGAKETTNDSPMGGQKAPPGAALTPPLITIMRGPPYFPFSSVAISGKPEQCTRKCISMDPLRA